MYFDVWGLVKAGLYCSSARLVTHDCLGSLPAVRGTSSLPYHVSPVLLQVLLKPPKHFPTPSLAYIRDLSHRMSMKPVLSCCCADGCRASLSISKLLRRCVPVDIDLCKDPGTFFKRMYGWTTRRSDWACLMDEMDELYTRFAVRRFTPVLCSISSNERPQSR